MTFEQQAHEYAQRNTDLKTLEKQVDKLKTGVKSYMKDNNMDKYEGDGFSISLGRQERTSMNDNALLAKLKELGLEEAIEMVPQVNEQKVQDLIYTGKLSEHELQSCLEVKIVEVLKVTKKKSK